MNGQQKLNAELIQAGALALGHEVPSPRKIGKQVCVKCGGEYRLTDSLYVLPDEISRPCGSEKMTGDSVRFYRLLRAISLNLWNRNRVELGPDEMLENYDFEEDKMVDRITGDD